MHASKAFGLLRWHCALPAQCQFLRCWMAFHGTQQRDALTPASKTMFVPLPLIPGGIAVITSEVVVDVWCGTAHGDGALARFSRGRTRHLATWWFG